MDCPICLSDSRVIDTRDSGNVIERIRRCKKCNGTWKTYESDIPPILDSDLGERLKLLKRRLNREFDKVMREYIDKVR